MINDLTEEQFYYLNKLRTTDSYHTGFYINSKHELSIFSISEWQLRHSLPAHEFITHDFNEFITLYEQHQLLKTLGD